MDIPESKESINVADHDSDEGETDESDIHPPRVTDS